MREFYMSCNFFEGQILVTKVINMVVASRYTQYSRSILAPITSMVRPPDHPLAARRGLICTPLFLFTYLEVSHTGGRSHEVEAVNADERPWSSSNPSPTTTAAAADTACTGGSGGGGEIAFDQQPLDDQRSLPQRFVPAVDAALVGQKGFYHLSADLDDAACCCC